MRDDEDYKAFVILCLFVLAMLALALTGNLP